MSRLSTPSTNEEQVNPETPQLRPDTGAIELLAYQFWLERDCPIGSPDEDWFRAEDEIRLLRQQAELGANG